MSGSTKPDWRRFYDEAFERFGVVALWNCAPNPGATPDEARAIARTLRRQGNMSAWRLADRLVKACDAA